MAVPTTPTYSIAALVAAHTAFRDLIDAGTGAGSIRIRDAADVLLAQIPLTDPCGSVHGSTGQLTLTPAARDESADASGTAAYGEFCDSAGLVHLAMPVQAGGASASGKLILNTTEILAGYPVEVIFAAVR